MGKILVVGCLSQDTIHLETDGHRKTYNTIGGAGLFTAMAAAHEGAKVTLYAPRPQPMPATLLPVAKAVNWIGPEVHPQDLPTLEIIHHGEDRATLIGASWGPEKLLTPDNLQAFLDKGSAPDVAFDAVHIAALSSPARQLQFYYYFCRCQNTGWISAGTYARAIDADRQTVRQLLDQCRMFFMNSNEARLLFQGDAIPVKTDQLVFVTDGGNGATIYQAHCTDHINAERANAIDPTGAGDTFCGAALAALTAGMDGTESARRGARLAAKVIEQPGSQFYF
jgi:sugar/nucleoside kinase (ribokinase family)